MEITKKDKKSVEFLVAGMKVTIKQLLKEQRRLRKRVLYLENGHKKFKLKTKKRIQHG